jgi:putative pyruvate formate lyase activating enzyme
MELQSDDGLVVVHDETLRSSPGFFNQTSWFSVFGCTILSMGELPGIPSYLELTETGELSRRAKSAGKLLRNCEVCPQFCSVNRQRDERGACGIGRLARVSSAGPHFGEEPPLVGRKGSGTVFFAGCSLSCCFCQNYDISQDLEGREVSAETLSSLFLQVQEMGCHNLNLVTPTHVIPQILEALVLAIPRGLRLPIVYNSGGYDSVHALRLLDGIVDIYMPDLKYGDSEVGLRFSRVSSYWDVAKEAVLEMHHQVGDLRIEDGIASRGILVRHLVLPGGLAKTREVMKFLSEEISRDTWVNVMDQYHPCHRAFDYPELRRRITEREYRDAVETARSFGIHRGIPGGQSENQAV